MIRCLVATRDLSQFEAALVRSAWERRGLRRLAWWGTRWRFGIRIDKVRVSMGGVLTVAVPEGQNYKAWRARHGGVAA